MNILFIFILLSSLYGFVPPAAGTVSPDTVIATINGRRITAGEVDGIVLGVPAETRRSFEKDRREFLKQYALLDRLQRYAAENKIALESPLREQLEWNRMQVLLQAAIAAKSKELAAEADLKKWLDEVRSKAVVHFENEAYFAADPAAKDDTATDTIVARVADRPLTAGQVREMLRGAGPKVRENYRKDRRQFLREYAMMLRLVEIAEQQKLSERSPYREQLEWVRLNVLAQGALNHYSDRISIGTKEEREYYDAHQDKYTEAKVRVIYLPFGKGEAARTTVNGKRVLSEDEARDLAEQVRKRADDGEDFVKLVQEFSQDEASRAQDGRFGSIRRSDKLPEHIKEAVFSTPAGKVTPPLPQPNGFYLFLVEESGTQTLDAVRQKLIPEAKAAKFNEWLQSIRQSVEVTFENEEYFTAAVQ